MIKRILLAGVLSVLTLLTLVQAAPLRQADIPAKAAWLAHVDVDAIHASSVMKAYCDALMADPQFAKFHEKMGKRWGIQLKENDLHGLTFYGMKFAPEDNVSIVYAKFDGKALVENAKKAPGHETIKDGDYTFHTWKCKKNGKEVTKAGTLFKPDVLVLASSVEMLKSALEVLGGKAASLEGSGSPLTEKVPDYAIFLARAVTSDPSSMAEKCPVFSQLKQLDYCEGQQGDQWKGHMTIVANDNAIAKNVAEVLQGLISVFWLGAGPTSQIRPILDNSKISQTGDTVKVDFQVPAKTLIETAPAVCKHILMHCKKGPMMQKQGPPMKKSKKMKMNM